MNHRNEGFTLIEVMVVVAIIGILAGIAYPSYMESVRKSNRSDAKVELNEMAQRLQRCYTTYSAYNHSNCDASNALKDGGKVTSSEGFYEIGASTLDATTYTLEASPVSGKTQAGDTKCTKFTLTNKGTRGATGSDANNCW